MALFKQIFTLLLICLTVFTVQAQTQKAYQEAAETAFVQRNYHAALEYFGILLEIEPDNYNYLYKYAESARGYNAYELADTIYRKVRLNADTLHPLATFWEAKMKQRMGQYVAAQMTYEFYLANHENYDKKYTTLAKRGLEEIDWAVETASEPDTDITIERLSDKVNSDYSEFAPLVFNDTLYYSSFAYESPADEFKPSRQYSRILSSRQEDFGDLLTDLNDRKRHTAHLTFTSDTSQVFYTLCDYVNITEVRCEIYTRAVNPDGSYGPAVKLPENVNVPGKTATQPHIGRDSTAGYDLLFFSSDRKGGRGGLDIWCSLINKSGEVGTPVNVPVVNSADDEITPFFHSPTQTLYYSSNGFLNLGGYDIFYSEKNKNKWSEPVNAGAPLNGSYDDTHYWLNGGEMIGLFSSNRPGSNYLDKEKEACCFDLYRARVTSIELNVLAFNKKTDNPLLGATITLFEAAPNGELKEIGTRTNELGNDFPWKLETGKKYVITGERTDFLPLRDTIDLSDPSLLTSRKIERKVYFEPEILDFLARVFDEESKDPLLGVTLQLFKNGQPEDLIINKDNHLFPVPLQRDQVYTVIVSKPGWFPDSLTMDLKKLDNPLTYEHDFYLVEKSIQDIVPMILYFDNDRPNPRTMRTTTDKTYSETASAYYGRKQTFIEEYTNVLKGRDRFLAENRMEAFFEREIKDGDESLKVFSSKLTELLDAGQIIKIYIKGYASPRAGAEYNYNLGRRRVDCIRNHFDNYAGGIFSDYLAQGKLNIEEISFGSSQAPKRLTDKLSDDRESVFGILASRERRVEIVGIRLDDGNTVIDTVKD